MAYQRQKTYISEWLNSRKHKCAILLLLSLYLWSLERKRERISELLGKYTSYFIFYFLQLNNFLGQCTFTMKCIRILPEVNWPQKSNLQRHKMLILLLLLICLISSFCIFGCYWLVPALKYVVCHPAWQLFKYGLGSYLIKTEATAMYSYH